jgi:hypothetical protein
MRGGSGGGGPEGARSSGTLHTVCPAVSVSVSMLLALVSVKGPAEALLM